jgi:hypothetical protein
MKIKKIDSSCSHCFHLFTGPIWMIIPDGQVLEKCCKCGATRLVHIDHSSNHWRPKIKKF